MLTNNDAIILSTFEHFYLHLSFLPLVIIISVLWQLWWNLTQWQT